LFCGFCLFLCFLVFVLFICVFAPSLSPSSTDLLSRRVRRNPPHR
jgi:hypothetical protein